MANDKKPGIPDSLSVLMYFMTLVYAGKFPVLGASAPPSAVTDLPSQEFRPEEHYRTSLAPVDTVNPKAMGTRQMQKGSTYRG